MPLTATNGRTAAVVRHKSEPRTVCDPVVIVCDPVVIVERNREPDRGESRLGLLVPTS